LHRFSRCLGQLGYRPLPAAAIIDGVARFQPALVPAEPVPASAFWFAVRGTELLLVENGPESSVPLADDLGGLGLEAESRHYLGVLDGIACFAAGLPEGAEPPAGAAFHALRPLWSLVGEELFALAGRAVQIVEWDRTHRFCGRCATPTLPAEGERAKRCPACGLLAFPRVSPAIIVRVTRGETILLARGRRWGKEVMYSVLAGFVDPGESLEECVAREVREEVGIDVTDLRYFGSQPWPFPHSLMVGFTAGYAGGEIRIDESELIDAQWFRAGELPPIPPRLSIARRLIDAWLDEMKAASS
jgi:NAD+ diphosphatase